MNPLLGLFLLIVAVALLVSIIASRPRRRQLTALGNVGEGYQPARRTFLADAVFASRYLLVKTGSSAAHIALTGVGDIPKAYTLDTPDVIGDEVGVAMLGLQCEGATGVASGAIDNDSWLVPGANGTVRMLPAGAGTYHIIGRATKAAADTDTVEYTPCFPIQRVVE